jgi:glyoxylate/hydroxypyruvate reductase A
MEPILFAASAPEPEQREWLAYLRAELAPHPVWALGELPDPAQVRVAIVANPPQGALAALPRLGLVQSLWAGVEKLLADPTIPPEVPLARMVDPQMNLAMAETALWATLSLHRGFFTYAYQQAQRQWRQLPQLRAGEIRVAVLGAGQMGAATARRLVQMGYRVTTWSRSFRPHLQLAATSGGPAGGLDAEGEVPQPAERLQHVHGEAALRGLLAESDIVINLLPLTPCTRGLFNAERLGWMPAGASLVNLARGAHVVLPDLLSALARGQLHHAVLDVFEAEPLPEESPLWSHPRVTVLPHAAALTDPRSAAAIAAANVRAWLAGQPVANLVDRSRGY